MRVMKCQSCGAENGADDIYCVDCGSALAGGPPRSPAATEVLEPGARTSDYSVLATPFVDERTQQGRKIGSLVWVGGAFAAILMIVGLGVGGYFIFGSANETLPDHLGLFARSKEKDRNDEIPRQDFPRVVDARNALLKNEELPAVDAQPTLIFYTEARDTPAADLRLIQLDTIKEDGTMMTLDFQVMPIEQQPDMKRMRVRLPMARGKYAFAMLDTYFNEGRHKFWAFQVKDSPVSGNDSNLKASSISLTPLASRSSNSATAAWPPGSTIRRVAGRVRMRSAPSLDAGVVRGLSAGEQVSVLGYTGYDCYQQRCGPWAQVTTSSGMSGYILSVLLR